VFRPGTPDGGANANATRRVQLLLSGLAIYAQPVSFEVASLKHVTPREGPGVRVGWWGGPGTNDPELFTAENVSLSRLITLAYALKPNQLTAPEWAGIERYSLNAKLRPGVTEDQFRLMLQNLLAERVALRVDWESKEVPGFDLVIAKAGPKFGESAKPAARAPEGYPVLPPGEESAGITERGRAVLRAHGDTMERTAEVLSQYLRRPVRNASGLAGKYDFTMYWVQNPDILPPDADSGPNLAEALEEQLGLKLVATHTAIRILVVEHAEKVPAENRLSRRPSNLSLVGEICGSRIRSSQGYGRMVRDAQLAHPVEAASGWWGPGFS